MNNDLSKRAPSRERDWMLVVDDEAKICEFLSAGLEGEGLEVVSASDGKMALKTVEMRGTEPLIVVVDVLMPGGIDGLTLARRLRDRLKKTKIALMSGHLSDDSWWPADLREIAFLSKPFRLAQVTELVEAARAEFRSGS